MATLDELAALPLIGARQPPRQRLSSGTIKPGSSSTYESTQSWRRQPTHNASTWGTTPQPPTKVAKRCGQAHHRGGHSRVQQAHGFRTKPRNEVHANNPERRVAPKTLGGNDASMLRGAAAPDGSAEIMKHVRCATSGLHVWHELSDHLSTVLSRQWREFVAVMPWVPAQRATLDDMDVRTRVWATRRYVRAGSVSVAKKFQRPMDRRHR